MVEMVVVEGGGGSVRRREGAAWWCVVGREVPRARSYACGFARARARVAAVAACTAANAEKWQNLNCAAAALAPV